MGKRIKVITVIMLVTILISFMPLQVKANTPDPGGGTTNPDWYISHYWANSYYYVNNHNSTNYLYSALKSASLFALGSLFPGFSYVGLAADILIPVYKSLSAEPSNSTNVLVRYDRIHRHGAKHVVNRSDGLHWFCADRLMYYTSILTTHMRNGAPYDVRVNTSNKYLYSTPYNNSNSYFYQQATDNKRLNRPTTWYIKNYTSYNESFIHKHKPNGFGCIHN